MRSIALVVGCFIALAAPALAQRAEIDAVNAKWIEFFNKGDFAGAASLYTQDATAFPPGSGMVKRVGWVEPLRNPSSLSERSRISRCAVRGCVHPAVAAR